MKEREQTRHRGPGWQWLGRFAGGEVARRVLSVGALRPQRLPTSLGPRRDAVISDAVRGTISQFTSPPPHPRPL